MKLKMYLAAFLAMSIAMGCSNDEIGKDVDANGEVVNPEDNVYVSVSVQLPNGALTRSHTVDPSDGNSTSSDNTEVGKDYENKVSRMLIVLARKMDNGYITHSTVDNEASLQVPQGTSTVRATAQLSKTALGNYYGGDNTLDAAVDQEINIFVVCNYTDELVANLNQLASSPGIDAGWINQIYNVTEDNDKNPYANVSVWGRNKMLMTNASVATKKLPLKLSDWDAFTASTVPFNLSGLSYTSNGESIDNSGSIRVERSVARFDFKDGSKLGGNRYNAVFINNDDGSTTNYVDIVLDRMALVNMSNKFYYFRRVTDVDDKDKDQMNVEVGWPELPWNQGSDGNYVVDVKYDTKDEGMEDFNFPLFNTSDNKTIDEIARGQWYTSKISDVLGYENDGYNDKSYHIWRYVTENTVNNTRRMINGLSTGVVFKGKMVPTDYIKNPTVENPETQKALKRLAYVLGYGQEDFTAAKLGLSQEDLKDITLQENTNTDPILYSHSGMLYLHWPSVREAAINDAKIQDTDEYDKSRSFYQAVFGSGSHEDGECSSDSQSPDYLWHEWQKDTRNSELLKAFKKAATEKGITLYQSSRDEDDGWGYYCYYFYWNQHNNNDNPSVMGEMEFAVVRNNVYKLAVTNISRLGHPRLSENDPDPLDPDDPDEKGDVYIEVSVEVLPWVVRLNNIEF